VASDSSTCEYLSVPVSVRALLREVLRRLLVLDDSIEMPSVRNTSQFTFAGILEGEARAGDEIRAPIATRWARSSAV
jgi:hypothetical protein